MRVVVRGVPAIHVLRGFVFGVQLPQSSLELARMAQFHRKIVRLELELPRQHVVEEADDLRPARAFIRKLLKEPVPHGTPEHLSGSCCQLPAFIQLDPICSRELRFHDSDSEMGCE